DDGPVAAPGGVERAAVMLRAAVHMRRGHGRLAAHRRIAERGVEPDIFMRDRDQARRRPAERARFRDRFLVEAELGAGREEHMIDAALRHRDDQRLAGVANLGFEILRHRGQLLPSRPRPLMTPSQRPRSSLRKAPNSSGLVGAGTAPTESRLATTSGSARIRFTSAASASTIRRGVPAGASMPIQATTSKPGSVSPRVGMSGALA